MMLIWLYVLPSMCINGDCSLVIHEDECSKIWIRLVDTVVYCDVYSRMFVILVDHDEFFYLLPTM